MRKRTEPKISTVTFSNKVLDYLEGLGYSESDISVMVRKPLGLIRLVRQREKPFTVVQLSTIAEALDMPYGQFLRTVDPREPKTEEEREFFAFADQMIDMIDRAVCKARCKPVSRQEEHAQAIEAMREVDEAVLAGRLLPPQAGSAVP